MRAAKFERRWWVCKTNHPPAFSCPIELISFLTCTDREESLTDWWLIDNANQPQDDMPTRSQRDTASFTTGRKNRSDDSRRASFARQLMNLFARESDIFSRRRRIRTIESLEQRVVLDGHCGHDHGLMDVLFAPGTPDEYREQRLQQMPEEGSIAPGEFAAFQFDDSQRWGGTTTDGGGLGQGDGTTITWSIVPDGTSIHGYNGEAAAPSLLRSSLDAIYGSISTWLPLFERSFERISELSGINYVYEPNDDGAAWTSSSLPGGQTGVRGDVRISGHNIDGGGGVLAYNFFPNISDMVIDTSDLVGSNPFFGNTGGDSIRLRNMLMHEAGHGLGINHVESNNASFLMEPFINTSFDGPQFDDVLAIHRGYGDVNELAGNDTPSTATNLGTLLSDQPIVIGADATGTVVSPSEVNFVSIDDASDVDFFQFTVTSSSSLTVSLDPLGPTYNQGSQGGSQSPFNAMAQSDLALQIYDQNGSTILASANVNGIGLGENVTDLTLSSAGTYYARISGAQSAAQMYQLQVTASTVVVEPGVTISETDGFTEVVEGGANDWYTVVLDSRPSGNVTISVNAGPQVTTNPESSLVFTPTNWNQPQTVVVSAVDDSVYEGNHFETITHNASGAEYEGFVAGSVTVSIIDDEQPNDPPIAINDSVSTLTGLPVGINLIANDIDDDGFLDGASVSIVSSPLNGQVVNNGDGTVVYTPMPSFIGTDQFAYVVSDDDGAVSNIASVMVQVTDGQVIFEDSFEGNADAWVQDSQGDWFLSTQRATDGQFSLEVDGRAFDASVELLNGIDISGYSSALLTFDWLIERGFDTGEYLSLDVSGDGGLSWTLDVLQLRGNESEEDVWNPGYAAGVSTQADLSDWVGSTSLKVRFRSTVSGSREDANVDNVKLWATGTGNPNNPPVAVDDSGAGFSTGEDNAFFLENILANDSDPDLEDVVTIQSVNASSLVGNLNDLGNGDFQYDPAGRFNSLAVGETATDSFSYTITDGRGRSDTATVTILINGVNDTPVAGNDSGVSFTTAFETSFTTPSVLGNDTDPDASDSLSVLSVDSQSLSGTLVNNGDGTFFYTPEVGFSGVDSFTYTVSDGNGGQDTGVVSITVGNPNSAPSANDDFASTFVGTATTIDLLANDFDSDGFLVSSTVSVTGQPSNGFVTNHADGTVTYTPVSGFVGTDTFTYTVRDDNGAESNTATVTVIVNDAPADQVLFEDSFEGHADAWIQDGQGDWFLSTQRATDGFFSLEVDGRASDAYVELVEGINISGYSTVTLSFDWFIERGFDRGEYLSLDISGDGGLSWTRDVRVLQGNFSQEDVWNPGYAQGESTQVDLGSWFGSTDLKIRFRSSVSGSREDANVDNVKVIGSNPIAAPFSVETGASVTGASSNQSDNGSALDSDDNAWFGSGFSSLLGDGAASLVDQMFGGLAGGQSSYLTDSALADWLGDHDDLDEMLNDLLSGGRLF